MKLTIKEMKEEVKRINKANYENLTSSQQFEISNLHAKYIKESGYSRQYLATTSKKDEVENFLTCLINANYDITGTCL